MRNPLANLYEAVSVGDDVAGRFGPSAEVDTPLRGGQGAVDWLRDERAWLQSHDAAVQAIHHIVTDTHASAEYVIALTHDGASIDLPLHLVAELEGDSVSALRTYHSTYPFTGEHIVRAPLVAPNPDLVPGPPLDTYEHAMRTADAATLDSLFEPDGYVREPAGAAFKHQGPDRMSFYGPAFSQGPVPLQMCTIIDDGAALAFEYVCDKWGPTDLPPQAGSAVYVRSGRGLLDAARIYDDVTHHQEFLHPLLEDGRNQHSLVNHCSVASHARPLHVTHAPNPHPSLVINLRIHIGFHDGGPHSVGTTCRPPP